jgi:hypothetical protein
MCLFNHTTPSSSIDNVPTNVRACEPTESDSEDDIPIMNTNQPSQTSKTTSSTSAECIVIAGKPLYLTSGLIGPETLRKFETSAKLYFRTKKTPGDEQVMTALGWIGDNLIQNWYWLSEA